MRRRTTRVFIDDNFIFNAPHQHAPNMLKTQWFDSECIENLKVSKNYFQFIEIKIPKKIGKTSVFSVKIWPAYFKMNKKSFR